MPSLCGPQLVTVRMVTPRAQVGLGCFPWSKNIPLNAFAIHQGTGQGPGMSLPTAVPLSSPSGLLLLPRKLLWIPTVCLNLLDTLKARYVSPTPEVSRAQTPASILSKRLQGEHINTPRVPLSYKQAPCPPDPGKTLHLALVLTSPSRG